MDIIDTRQAAKEPATHAEDPMTELMRRRARGLTDQAVETALQTLLDMHADHQLPDCQQAVVRSGYLPERKPRTSIGEQAQEAIGGDPRPAQA